MRVVRVEARHGESALEAVIEYPTAEQAQAAWDEIKVAAHHLFEAAFNRVPLSVELTLVPANGVQAIGFPGDDRELIERQP